MRRPHPSKSAGDASLCHTGPLFQTLVLIPRQAPDPLSHSTHTPQSQQPWTHLSEAIG